MIFYPQQSTGLCSLVPASGKTIICTRNNKWLMRERQISEQDLCRKLCRFFTRGREASWAREASHSLTEQTWKYPPNPAAAMVCGGFVCTKNALCALNILYVVSRSSLLLHRWKPNREQIITASKRQQVSLLVSWLRLRKAPHICGLKCLKRCFLDLFPRVRAQPGAAGEWLGPVYGS